MENQPEARRPIGTYSTPELRAICQKTAPNPARESKVGLFTRIFSIYFTRMFLYTNIHPNIITAISVALFFAGIGFFYFEDMLLQLAGVFLVFMSIVVDGCDGEVARFRRQVGPVGAGYTEPVSHDIQYGWSYLMLGLFVYLWGDPIVGEPWWYLALGAVASIAKLEFRLLEIRFWTLMYSGSTPEDIETMKSAYTQKSVPVRFVYWLHKNFLTSTGVLPALLIAAVTGRLDLVMIFFAGGYLLFWLALSAKQYWGIYKKFYAQQ